MYNLYLLVAIFLTASVTANTAHHRKEKNHEKLNQDREAFDNALLMEGDDEFDDDDWHPDELEESVRVERFEKLARKMDENKNGFVEKTELVHWTLRALQNMDERELEDDWHVADADGDGFIDWDEYVENVYGIENGDHKEENLTVDKIEEQPELQDYNRHYHREFAKFMAADANEDGKLDNTEYKSFYNPGHGIEQVDYAVKEAMHFVDANGDGMLSKEEFQNDYINPAVKMDEQAQEQDDLMFDELDLNNNKFLDGDELTLWIQIDNGEIAVDEAMHLMDTADHDEDGKLSIDEVVEAMEDFIESDATEYGQMLRHDEL